MLSSNWADYEYGIDYDQEEEYEEDVKEVNFTEILDHLSAWECSTDNILFSTVTKHPSQHSVNLQKSLLINNSVDTLELLDALNSLNTIPESSEILRRKILKFDKWYSRNQVGRKPNFDGELKHLIMCLELAKHLADKYIILDVDAVFSESFPSASDITFMSDDGVLFLIDITSQTSIDAKFVTLSNQASVINYDGLICVLCLQFTTNIKYDTRQDVMFENSWDSGTEMLLEKMAPMVLAAEKSELESLSECLDSILREEIISIMPSSNVNHNDLDKLKSETMEVFSSLLSVLSIPENTSEAEKRSLLRDFITGNSISVTDAFQSLLVMLRNNRNVNKVAKKFIVSDFESLLALDNLRGLLCRPPVSIGTNYDDHANLDFRVDYMFWVLRIANEHYSKEGHDDKVPMVFKMDGTYQPLSVFESASIPWDKQQSQRTRFHTDVVAYTKPVSHKQIMYVKETKNNTTTLTEKQFFEMLKDPNVVPNQQEFHKEWQVVEETVYAKHFQFLFNPKYSTDDNFITFLSRNNKLQGQTPYKKFVPLASKIDQAVDAVEEFLDKSIYSIHNLASQHLNKNSTLNKMSHIATYKVSPNMIPSIKIDSHRMKSGIFDYIDNLGVQAKAFAAHVGIKHPSNCVVFLNSGSYTSWTLWYLPGSFPHFNSTWRKVYTISEMPNMSIFKTCPLRGVKGDRDEVILFKRLPLKAYEMLETLSDKESLRIDKYVDENPTPVWQLYFTSSQFKSIDKNNLEWELELSPKVLLRSFSLCEMREKLYSQETDNLINMKLVDKELALGALLMCVNSQQHSIQSTAYRYLHQALNSRDFDPFQIVNKILDTRCKSVLEVYYVSRMMIVYKLALLIRLHAGIDVIRAENKEICIMAPDFLRGSSSAVLNKASYNKPNSFNKDKQYRVSSEADCVKALWDQIDDLNNILTNDREAYIGMPIDLFCALKINGLGSIDDLKSVLLANQDSLRAYTRRILHTTSMKPLVNNFWHEFWGLINLRLEIETVSMSEILSGKPINELFTIKGSTTSLKLTDLNSNLAKRKVTAMCVMLQRLEHEDSNIDDANTITNTIDSEVCFDMLSVTRKIMGSSYVRASDMICQFSEKDAPGKSREISTLNIEFGVLSLINEIVAAKASEQIPEDLITHSSKEEVIYKNVVEFEREVTSRDKYEVIYVNQDKSRFGPNRKNASMLLTALIISKDQETFNNFSFALYKSSKRKVAYPHEIVKQALDIRKVNIESINKQISNVKQAFKVPDQRIYEQGFTSKVMNEILDQYHNGNKYGPKSTFYAEPVEGMAGQGIGGIISSIQHAAMCRLASKLTRETLGWKWRTFVTSDDSLTCVVYPKGDSMKVHNGIKNYISRFNYSCGLIENLGKFTASSQGSEMNGFFMLNGEPIVSVWKFGIAYSSIQTSGNIGEDLLACISKCNDLYRKGGSYYLCCILGLSLMTFVLDAYRLWSSYLYNLNVEDISYLWTLPPEILGLPVIDPVSAIISPIGTRISSIRSERFTPDESQNYIRFLLESTLTSSKYDQVTKNYESKTLNVQPHLHLVETDEGGKFGLNARLPPTVNGLIGSLNRRSYDTRLAMEIGEIVKAHTGKSSSSRYKLDSLLCSITESLQIPVKNGTTARSVFDQFKDVAHSPNFPFLKVTENSFFDDELKGKKISLNNLRDIIKSKAVLERMETRFLNTLKVENKFKTGIGNLLKFLVMESNKCKIISDYMWSCNLVRNKTEFDYDESKSEKSRFKNTRRRLLALHPEAEGSEGLSLDFDLIRSEIFSQYYKHDHTKEKKLRYTLERGDGDMEENEAILQTDNTISRLKALLPVRQMLYTESPAGIHDRTHDMVNWLRMNAKDGHIFSTSYQVAQLAMNLDMKGRSGDNTNSEYLEFNNLVNLSIFNEPQVEGDLSLHGASYNRISGAVIRTPKETVYHYDGVTSLEMDRELIMGKSKLRLEWTPYVAKFSKLPTSTWYGNQHYRVKFKGIRSNLMNVESSYLTSFTIKTNKTHVYDHLIVVYCNNKLQSKRKGSKTQDILEIFKDSLKFENSDTPSDRYHVIYIDRYTITSLVLLGMRTFIRVIDDAGVFLLPTSDVWNLTDLTMESALSLQAMKDAQEAHLSRTKKLWVIKSNREVKDLSSLKTPITKWQKDHERDFNEFCDFLKEVQPGDFKTMTTRFKLAILDIYSSFFIDGDLKGLRDTKTNEGNNDSIHDSPGYFEKVLRADHIASWVSRCSSHIIEHICTFYKIWDKFRTYFTETFIKSGNADMINAPVKHNEYLGDDESAYENVSIRKLGMASSVLDSDFNLKEGYKEQHKPTNSRFNKLKEALLSMKNSQETLNEESAAVEDRFARVAARLKKHDEPPKIEDTIDVLALLDLGTADLDDLSEENITFG